MSAIDDKYHALGGPGGFLGHPHDEGAGSHEMETRNGRGRFRDFQGGSIYWTPQTGAHEVHGDIRNHWANMGWENSFLRYPISDEMPDGNGRFSQFQGGSIHWTPDGSIDVRQRID